MAEQGTFWQRVSSMFRVDAPWRGGDGAATIAPPPASNTGLRTTSLSTGWFRRPPAPSQAALQVAQLAEAMQAHFQRQDERAVELVQSLNRVGVTLEQLAEAQRTQGDYLRAIADNTESVGRNAAAMHATVNRVPEALHAQADAVRTVARQLEVSQEASTQMMLSLQQFSRAVDTLDASGHAQADVLQRLSAAQQEQYAALTQLVQAQSRRATLHLVVAVGAGLVALAALVLAALLFTSRGLPPGA
jgi:hypothetical protein